MIQRSAVYIHIPFCRARCAYCDFSTYAGLDDLVPAYVSALCTEVKAAPPITVRTLYLGGGTPSLLPLEQLALLLRAVRAGFHVPRDVEITLEANPGTVTPSTLRGLRDLGVNRLSLGVQSSHEDELHLLGRIHTWTEAVEAWEAARATGFDNLNLDLIYGLPRQSMLRWQRTLEAALALEPEHLSLYALSVEEGTRLARQIARGELPEPDDDLSATMYDLAQETLAKAGFFHYEISNWARRDRAASLAGNGAPPPRSEEASRFVCRHNLAYWRNEPYLGFGAGAASWWGGRRWTNVRHPAEYVARVTGGQPVTADTEQIGSRLEMGETMMMGLRLAEGVRDDLFRARFGVGLEEFFAHELAESRDLGLLAWDGRVARLTARGRLLGNQVFQRFLPD
jgi:oxygen-independent coproporphyrinogen-3 oxidase